VIWRAGSQVFVLYLATFLFLTREPYLLRLLVGELDIFPFIGTIELTHPTQI
jgi:hypothetical protein